MIELVAGPCWVVDAGEAGHRWRGTAVGGALVLGQLAAANLAIGNPWAARALEAPSGAVIRTRVATSVGTPGGAVDLAAGEQKPFRGYLAIAGGVRRHVGPLGRGEQVLGAGAAPGNRVRARLRPGVRSVRVLPGPDPGRLGPDALARLCRTIWTVGLADRVGVRLDGPPLDRRGEDRGLSCPMILGAIQVPAGGRPIVLGPDGPVTGGYPLVAVVASVDLDAMFSVAGGDPVSFRCVSVAEAVTAGRRARPLWLRRP